MTLSGLAAASRQIVVSPLWVFAVAFWAIFASPFSLALFFIREFVGEPPIVTLNLEWLISSSWEQALFWVKSKKIIFLNIKK